MKEIEYIQNLRLALEETNRWHRQIDNFFWVLSSFLLAGSGFAISQALKMNGENYKVVFLSFIMSSFWYLYRLFRKDTMNKILFCINKTNYFEKELKIDVQPEDMTRITKGKGRSCHWIMGRVTYLFWFIWLYFIIEFFDKYWYNLSHPCCCPFY